MLPIRTAGFALSVAILSACAEAPTTPALEASDASFSTAVRGQEGRSVVTGKYNSLYVFDASGDYYWDLGDGRIDGTVDSPADLDQATRTDCVYQVVYRGSFGGDEFLNDGWIRNNINCKGYEHGTYNSVIVHRTDPRFDAANPGPGWGPDWVYHVDTWSGYGNVLRPSFDG